MSNYFTIKAGRHKTAKLNYDSAPGAEILTDVREILEPDPDALIYLNTDTGNDSYSGYSPSQAKKTYAAAAAAVTSQRPVIQLENSTTLTGNITAPIQVKRGVLAAINPAPTASGLNTFLLGASYGADVLRGICYSPKLKRMVVVGNGNNNAYYSNTDGATWSPASGYAASGVSQTRLRWSQAAMRFILTAGNRIHTSSNGINWSIGPKIAAANEEQVLFCDYSAVYKKYIAVGTKGGVYSGADVDSFKVLPGCAPGASQFGNMVFGDVLCDNEKIFLIGNPVGSLSPKMYLSTDGITFTEIDITAFGNGNALMIRKVNNRYIAMIGQKYGFSDDGITWTVHNTPDAGTQWIDFAPAFGKWVACASPDKIFSSIDGVTWVESQADGFVSYQIFGIASGEKRVAAVGRANPSNNSIIRYSYLPQLDITTDIAGFRIYEANLSGAGSVRSCTMNYAERNGGNMVSCRVNTLVVTGNQFTATRNLIGDAVFNCSPAQAGDIEISRNTIYGRLQINNTAATNRERIVDNIIRGGIQAAYRVKVSSGNTQGENENAIFTSLCSFTDPLFVDFSDFKLQYESQGFSVDSPLVKRSTTYINANGERADYGAWSGYETDIVYRYVRAFTFLKPSSKDSVSHIRHMRTALHVSIDGTPDVFVDVESKWEELVLNYQSLPAQDISDSLRNHIAFVDYLDSLLDTTVEISFDPDFEPVQSVVVNGTHPSGTIVLALQPSEVRAGDRITVFGTEYFVLYVYGHSVVLSAPLKVSVSNGSVLPVLRPAGYGEYKYVPSEARRLTRWHESAQDFFRGLSLRFVRKVS
jgi:hypothetical protein